MGVTAACLLALTVVACAADWPTTTMSEDASPPADNLLEDMPATPAAATTPLVGQRDLSSVVGECLRLGSLSCLKPRLLSFLSTAASQDTVWLSDHLAVRRTADYSPDLTSIRQESQLAQLLSLWPSTCGPRFGSGQRWAENFRTEVCASGRTAGYQRQYPPIHIDPASRVRCLLQEDGGDVTLDDVLQRADGYLTSHELTLRLPRELLDGSMKPFVPKFLLRDLKPELSVPLVPASALAQGQYLLLALPPPRPPHIIASSELSPRRAKLEWKEYVALSQSKGGGRDIPEIIRRQAASPDTISSSSGVCFPIVHQKGRSGIRTQVVPNASRKVYHRDIRHWPPQRLGVAWRGCGGDMSEMRAALRGTTSVESRYLATSLPRYLVSSLPRYIATSLPRYLATSLPRYHLTSLPRYLATSLLRYLDTSSCCSLGVCHKYGGLTPQSTVDDTMTGRAERGRDVQSRASKRVGCVLCAERGFIKKIVMPFLLGLKFKATALVPLALGLIALKTWKALTLGLLSLVLSGAMLVFKLTKPKVVNYEVYHYPQPAPVIEHSAPAAYDPHHHGWGRAADLAYRGHVPS
ncbi:hypothetical protein PR048_029793 [Dryococelus australis]|uniref:Uncharacterized protein n=1 Tax=Dryococelus australis TaxID=614101 RepID=A0ABQ9G827_9NEOP|nr:hypothetical protein PR048_029793 [Dryococelus australis]